MNPGLTLPKKVLPGSVGNDSPIRLRNALKCVEEKLGYDDEMEEESLETQKESGDANLRGQGYQSTQWLAESDPLILCHNR